MAERTKRAHANGLKLTEITDWGISEPKTKRAKTRKTTPVEPEEMEIEGGSGEEEDRGTISIPLIIAIRARWSKCQSGARRQDSAVFSCRLYHCEKGPVKSSLHTDVPIGQEKKQRDLIMKSRAPICNLPNRKEG